MHDHLRIVLVGTQHPGNIGSAARAMKTMGLTRLVLVAPQRFPHPEAVALAADCRLVVATTARRRTVPIPEFSPREAAARLVAEQASGQVALVFGRERTGLENEELQLCHASVSIPANPDYSSLNLAAAVQVLAYELRVAALERAPAGPMPVALADELPASHEQLEAFFAHLAELLREIDFHKGKTPDIVLQRLRRLFQRARPDPRELRILRGIFSDTQRLLRKPADS